MSEDLTTEVVEKRKSKGERVDRRNYEETNAYCSALVYWFRQLMKISAKSVSF